VAETLTWSDSSGDYEAPGITYGLRLNERIAKTKTYRDLPVFRVTIETNLLIDIQKNEIPAKQVAVLSRVYIVGFWTDPGRTSPYGKQFLELSKMYRKLGRKLQ